MPNQTETKNPVIREIANARGDQLDALWALLKYRDINIHRKIKAMALVLLIDYNEDAEILVDFPVDADGLLINRDCRHIIHDALISRSKEFNEIQHKTKRDNNSTLE